VRGLVEERGSRPPAQTNKARTSHSVRGTSCCTISRGLEHEECLASIKKRERERVRAPAIGETLEVGARLKETHGHRDAWRRHRTVRHVSNFVHNFK
jgi:hypothetical protein